MSSRTACLKSFELLLESRADPNMRLSGGVLTAKIDCGTMGIVKDIDSAVAQRYSAFRDAVEHHNW